MSLEFTGDEKYAVWLAITLQLKGRRLDQMHTAARRDLDTAWGKMEADRWWAP